MVRKKRELPVKTRMMQQGESPAPVESKVEAPAPETTPEPTPIRTPELLTTPEPTPEAAPEPVKESAPEDPVQKEIDTQVRSQEEKNIETTVGEVDKDIEEKSDPAKDHLQEANLLKRASIGALLNDLENDRVEYRKKEEAERKNARRKAVLGGVTEAVSAVAGLIGTTKGATPVKPTNYTAKWMEEADRMKKESQVRYDQDRQKRRQARQDAINAEIAMKQGMAEYERRREKEKADREITKQKMAWDQYKDQRKMSLDLYNAETNRVKAGNTAAYNEQTLEERIRHNKAMEGNSSYRAAVTARNNEARAEETKRNNEARAEETRRHNQATEAIDRARHGVPEPSGENTSPAAEQTPQETPQETPAPEEGKKKTEERKSKLDKFNK